MPRPHLLPTIILSICVLLLQGAAAGEVEMNEEELRKNFEAVDKDGSGTLDKTELPNWVRRMVEAHVSENIPAAKREFKQADSNRDKIVEWREYGVLHGGSEPSSEDKHKFRTADENGDGVLSQMEYVAFRNPLTTEYTLNRIAQELLEDFDTNKDKKVTTNEFVHHAPSRVDDKDDKEIDKMRKMEFRGTLDTNNDLSLDVKELKDYLYPLGVTFLTNEARHIMHNADTNQDNVLSFAEVQENYLHFQRSRENPVIQALHDEL